MLVKLTVKLVEQEKLIRIYMTLLVFMIGCEQLYFNTLVR